MEKGIVSIMIPCYNGELFLDRLFRTILQQTYKKIQIIFADDGSEDGTRDMVEKYYARFEQEGIQLKYLYQRNGGLASAINLALPHVSGEYCMWFDVDDLMSIDHIEKKVHFLQEHPECDFVMCTGYMYDERDLDIPVRTLGEEKAVSTLFEDILLERRRCTQGLYMVRTDVLMEVLPDKHIYDTNRRMGQNMQLLLPITLRNHTGHIEDKLFYYVIREDSLSHSFERDAFKQIVNIEHGQDIREHVLDTLPITKEYMSFLKQKLELMVCIEKFNALNHKIEIDMPDYVRKVVFEYLNYAHIMENVNGRNIMIWGKCEYTEKVVSYLNRYMNVHITAFIESNSEKCDNKYILPRKNIDRENMYLIIPLEYHDDIANILMKRGFINHKDFFYPKYELREIFAGKKIINQQFLDSSKDKIIYEYPVVLKYLRNKVRGWNVCDFLKYYGFKKIVLYAITELVDLIIDDIEYSCNQFFEITVCDTNADRFSKGHRNHPVIDVNKLLLEYREGNIDCIIICSLLHENEIIKNLMDEGVSQNVIISIASIIFSVD